jgi:hypothetical protein
MTLIPESADATVPDPSPPGRGTFGRQNPQLVGWHRALLIGTGALLVLVLITARWLTPDASGIGTHRQLGFGECGFARWAGVPCPSCGMTTAWAHVVRGEWMLAARCNLGGALAGITALWAGPWMLVSGIRGRWWIGQPAAWIVVALASATYFAIIGQWLGRWWFS